MSIVLDPLVVSIGLSAAIVSVKDEQPSVLVVHHPRDSDDALPFGPFDPLNHRTLDSGLRTWVAEQTYLDLGYAEQLYTFGDPGRDPRTRVITVVYFALLDSARLQVRAADDAADVGWFSVYQLPPLAFDHEKILHYALARLRGKLDYTTIAFSLLPEQFTLRELQRVYEIILHRKLDKRNFRKKILATGILEDTGDKKMEGTHRPARLYRFNPSIEGKL